ncbi:MAG: hypothetical protein BHW64_03730 [Candidatus Melainabacteria bacterium LEY3_CP_29_8]|nr:MAG: hypothetical protein BHW64_03730 [Candidatus Melainabacteria bacterium LEY3_CP_29_8]
MSFNIDYNMYAYKPMSSIQFSSQKNENAKGNQKNNNDNLQNSIKNNKNAKVSIFYMNDVHGQVPRMEQLTSAAMAHDLYVKSNNIDGLKLASGDIMLGKNEAVNKTALSFLQLIGTNGYGLGNHEFDAGATQLHSHIKNSDLKILGMNLNYPKDESKLKDKIVRSSIEEINGNKYGIIGVQPSSLSERVQSSNQLEGITVDSIPKTIVEIQEEVNMLKEKGINKIILLSHSGYEVDKAIAKYVDGLDVILGGHSHDLIEGIKEGENLFYSKSNEPIIITQAGRDGKNFGVLDLEFDENGKIIKAKNDIKVTDNYPRNIITTCIANKYFNDVPEIIGDLTYTDKCPQNQLIAENPFASFIADGMKTQLKADIALINSGNLRGTIPKGQISSRDVSSIVPFKNRMTLAYVSQSDLVEALKFFGKSLKKYDSKPGILQVSGIRYELNKDGELKKLYFVNKYGNKEKIDIENPDKNKKYLVAMDDYVSSANECPECIKKLNTKDTIQVFDYDKDKLAIDYIKSFSNKPFEIKCDGRIKIDD